MAKKKETTAQSIPAGAVIQNIIIQPARVESADIGTWRTALNSASRIGDRSRLYDLMDNVMMDSVLSSAVERRINKITNAEITFQLNGEAVEAIDDMIDTPEFEDLVREIALSRAYGKSVIELGFKPELSVFSIPRKNVRITNLDKPLSQRKKFIALRPTDTSGYDYTEDDWIIEAGKDDDYGYIFKASAYVIYKRGGFGDWAQYAEIFGMPFLVGKYNSMDENQRDKLFQALSEMGGKPVAAIPDGTELSVHDVGGKSTDLFERFKKACDEEILISVLGQTMTTIDGSSRSQAEVHSDTEEGIAQSDRRYVQRMLNRFFVPLLIKRGYNVQGGFFLFPDQGENISTKDRLDMGFKMRGEGLPVDENYFFEITGIPRAEKAEEKKGEKQEPKEPAKKDKEKKAEEPAADESKEEKLSEAPPLGGRGASDTGPGDERNFFKRLTDFFVNARTSGSRANPSFQNELTNSTDDINRWLSETSPLRGWGVSLSEAEAWSLNETPPSGSWGVGIDINKLFKRALRNIYKKWKKEGKADIVEKELFDISNNVLQEAVESEFKAAGVEFGKKNEEFINEFKHNMAVFAAFKNHRQTNEIVEQLLDDKGNLRSFYDFQKAVLGTTIKNDYNRNWLQTEYNMAVRSARNAAKFKKYQETAHIYPNLEYMPSTAATPREKHQEYYGTILPIDHPWWDTHMPPSEWGCECGIRNTDKPVTAVPKDSHPVNPVFDNNPGKTAEFINLEEHPYIKGVDDNTAKKIKSSTYRLISSVYEQIKKFKNGGMVLAHRKVNRKDSDYKDILTISTEFARMGKVAVITPKLHYKSYEYRSVYAELIDTPYYKKCPDLKVDDMFYEYESYVPPFSRRKVSSMLKRGASQSSRIIINNNKGATDRYIRANIISRLNDKNFKHDIEEVWLYEKGKLRLLFKKQ